MSQEGEDRLKRCVAAVLQPHFDLHSEIWGTHVSTNRRIRIDFLLEPKPELVAREFDAHIVGLEIKEPEPDGDVSKAIELANQSLDYAETVFDSGNYWHKGETVYGRPDFVLIYPPITTHFTGHANKHLNRSLLAIRCLNVLMQKRGVGYLKYKRDRSDWEIDFGQANIFYRWSTGKGGFQSILHRDEWRGSKS